MAASWKKVIVSGSNAILNQVNVNTNQQIASSPASTYLSGSFSGSFHGDGSDLSGIVSNLYISASANSGGSDTAATISLKTQALVVSGSSSKGLYASAAGTALSFDLAQSVKTDATVTFKSITATNGFTGSFTGSAALPTLSQGTGITAFTYNGSGAATVAVSGAASLTANYLTKWEGAKFVNSNITDDGTAVTVTGKTTFNNSVVIAGDLTVNGTASFVNVDNLLVKDKFITIASGSSSLTDGGLIVQYSAAGTGSAFYLEAASTSTYGRFAVAYGVAQDASSVTADEFVVTVKQNASNPVDATPPTWGGSSNGYGNMWINTNTDDIFIWA